MRDDRLRHLPEQSGECLGCACSNPENLAARELLNQTGATSAVGVLATIFVADSPEHDTIVALSRDAIVEQRAWCEANGPFKSNGCPVHGEK